MKLPVATLYTPTLVQLATKAIDRFYKKGYGYKRVGVLFKELVPENQVQQNLFWASDALGEKALMTVIDQINGEMGAGTVRFAQEGFSHGWGTWFEATCRELSLGCPNCKWQLGNHIPVQVALLYDPVE